MKRARRVAHLALNSRLPLELPAGDDGAGGPAWRATTDRWPDSVVVEPASASGATRRHEYDVACATPRKPESIVAEL